MLSQEQHVLLAMTHKFGGHSTTYHLCYSPSQ